MEALNWSVLPLAADSIVDAISIITGVLFCDQKTSFSQIRLRLRPNLSSEIRPNSASTEFEKVKFGATLAREIKIRLS